jgi:hypothetical protein
MPNPLKDVVAIGKRLLELAGEGPPPKELLREYKENEVRRDFAEDLLARAATVSFAFDRLHELTPLFNEIWREVDAKRSKANDPVEIPREVLEKEDRWGVEADAMTALIYYEIKSIADMLSEFGIEVETGTELEYLLKARDRFLAHPKLLGIARRANRGGTIPIGEGFLRRDAVNLNTLDYDRAAVDGRQKQVKSDDWPKERVRNKEIIRTAKRNEKLTPEQITQVMAFGVRDADVEKAVAELATVFKDRFLPIVKELSAEAREKFGFEPYPEGPTYSVKWSGL